ncbi:MAG TPA: hypothetical protein VG738_00780 [Chitinophagaceae bacterium]|nr:hypothetical protein [Chitinophagaceae bacterium]
MVKNFCKVAFRNFRRNSFFSFVNIVSLATGISAALVIFLFVEYDFSFDKFEKDINRIYRVVSAFKVTGETFKTAGVPYPLYNAVNAELTGVEAAKCKRVLTNYLVGAEPLNT